MKHREKYCPDSVIDQMKEHKRVEPRPQVWDRIEERIQMKIAHDAKRSQYAGLLALVACLLLGLNLYLLFSHSFSMEEQEESHIEHIEINRNFTLYK